MKKFFLVFVVVFCSGITSAQYYCIKTIGTGSEYAMNSSSGNILLSGFQGLSEKLSGVNTLPFQWHFYGYPVSQYKVSTSGYLTFDLSQLSDNPHNVSLPDSTAPRKAIFAFWDSLKLEPYNSYPADIRTWTYGVAPNRVAVVQWRLSQSLHSLNATEVTYFAIRIYESGGFDIVENYGFGSFSATIGCQNAAGNDGAQVTGSPSLNFGGHNGNYDASLSDVYTFREGIQPGLRIGIHQPDTLLIKANTNPDSITLKINNEGKNDIQNYRIYCLTHGVDLTARVISDLLVAQSGEKTIRFPYNINFSNNDAGKFHSVKLWIMDYSNQLLISDTMDISIFVNLGVSAPRKILLEEMEGAWCGYTPEGDLQHKRLLEANPDQIVSATYHSADGMTTAQSDSLLNGLGTVGFPATYIDRVKFPDYTALGMTWGYDQAKITQRLNTPAPVTVSVINKSYNALSRTLEYDVSATFVDYAMPGDLRITTYIVEDNVRGENTSQWNQRNYYSYEDAQAGGTTHELYLQPKYIEGYLHHHVLRASPSGVWGTPHIIPSSPAPNQNYIIHYSYKVPPLLPFKSSSFPVQSITTYGSTLPGDALNKAYDMKVVAFVSYYNADNTKRQIINATEVNLAFNTGISEQQPALQCIQKIYPNPVSDYAALEMSVLKTGYVKLEITTLTGQTLDTVREGLFASGDHTVYFETRGLSEGIYLLRMTSDEGISSTKWVKVNAD